MGMGSAEAAFKCPSRLSIIESLLSLLRVGKAQTGTIEKLDHNVDSLSKSRGCFTL
jgi:hypothetical protein